MQRIYTERHGSMESHEEFVAGIEEGDRAARRQQVADSRIEEPRDLPAMADNEYDYPVLVDDGFVTRHPIPGFPTTWFADTNGRIVFEYTGASTAV